MFQRYYELIRHQKNHCFKEENNKKSAKAQIAAAQIAQSLSSEDSNSSMDINSSSGGGGGGLATSAVASSASSGMATANNNKTGGGGSISVAQNLSLGSPGSHSAHSTSPSMLASPPHYNKSTPQPTLAISPSLLHRPHSAESPATAAIAQKYECDKCALIFPRYELYKEHQLIHIMNPNLFLGRDASYAQNTPFGILQNMSASGGGSPHSTGTGQCTESIDLSQRQKKRKYSESSCGAGGSVTGADDATDYETLSKKLKNEQFDFLYGYFMQNEPSDEVKKTQPIDFESLHQYYENSEMKKKTGPNFDFLYQYYLQNDKPMELTEKPSFEFLFQYYQINESKKFFQLEASPQRTTADHHPFQMSGGGVVAVTVPKTPLSGTGGAAVAPLASAAATGALLDHHTPNRPTSTATPPSMPSAELLTSFQQTMTTPTSGGASALNEMNLTAAEKQNNKRLRTTILPEQLNFLYECYQNESNPSRKMLEEISKKVNLKKRVVQVNNN